MVFFYLWYSTLSFSQNSTQKLATANKCKTNIMNDEGFIHPSKSSKTIMSTSKNTPNFNIENKFETLYNMFDDFVHMDNDITIIPLEPKPQPIFMKMAENFSDIISTLENFLNSTLKKKVSGDLIQIYPILSENKIEFFAVQFCKERPKKIL